MWVIRSEDKKLIWNCCFKIDFEYYDCFTIFGFQSLIESYAQWILLIYTKCTYVCIHESEFKAVCNLFG